MKRLLDLLKWLLNPLLNDKIISGLIVFNAIVIASLLFDGLPFALLFKCIDILLTFIFVFEIGYKIYIHKGQFFKDGWNVFDFLCVSISAVPLVILLFNATPGFLETAEIARVLRLFKLFRSIRMFPNAKKITSNFVKALKVTGSLLLYGLVIFVFIGILLCSIFREIAPEHFGDPIISIYSVFRLFSVDGWNEIPEAMSTWQGYGYLIRIAFVFIVLFGMFIFGFIISSICDQFARDNNDELLEETKKLEDKIDELNRKIDMLLK